MSDKTDEKIIAVVRAGANRFIKIGVRVGLTGRALDRRLQRLRRNGVLEFSAGDVGWTVVPAERKP